MNNAVTMWNELSFETQSLVLSRVLNLLDEEPKNEMREAIIAAFLELRMWSNFPCPIIDDPVQAQDSYEE